MTTIVMSEKLGDTFIQYMHDCVMRDINDLSRDGDEGRLRTYLIQSVIHGGQRRNSSTALEYRDRLSMLFYNTDHVLRFDLDDYEIALNATLQ